MMERKRVLISSIAVENRSNGVFSRSLSMAVALVNEGYDVVLLRSTSSGAWPISKEIIQPGLLVVKVRAFAFKKMVQYGMLPVSFCIRLWMIYRVNPNYIISDQHRLVSAGPGFLYKTLRSHVAIIYEWQDYFGKGGLYDGKSSIWRYSVGILDNLMERLCIQYADYVIVLSEELKRKALEIREDSRIFKLWGASDLKSIGFEKDNTIHRDRFNFKMQDILLFSAGFSEADYISNSVSISILKKLRREGIPLRFVRTGRPFSSNFKSTHCLDDGFFVDLGNLNERDYSHALSCADLCFLMQTNEYNNICRWPNVIGDYIAAGRPIFTNLIGEIQALSRMTSLVELLYVVEENCINDYRRIILLFKDKDEKQSILFTRINEFAKIHFSWSLRGAELRKILNNIKV